MQILNRALADIDEEYLNHLVEDQIPESRTHDYKAKIPHRLDDASKARFIEAAGAFANTAGGIFVFGISEAEGKWSDHGLEDFNEDRDVLRLQDMLRSGLEPRLPQSVPRVIRRDGRNPILLLGIPFSLLSPH